MGGGFLRKKFEKQNLILPAAHGQLEKTNPGGSDMDSGHVGGSISKNKYSLASEFNILLNYWIISKHPRKYIKNL